MAEVMAIRHVAYEDLDGFETSFRRRGYRISYRDAWYDDLVYASAADVLVILGAPVGVYENETYPFIHAELKLIEERLKANKPVLGICFGAQLLAQVLGSTIRKSDNFEFGWQPIQLTKAGMTSPLAAYGEENVRVFHCHGDTFDIPRGAELLASTDLFSSQAFSYGPHLAIQFHGEVTARGLKRWYIGHSARVKAAMGVQQLLQDSEMYAPKVEPLLDGVIGKWLESSCSHPAYKAIA